MEFRHKDTIGHTGNRKPIEEYPLKIRDHVKIFLAAIDVIMIEMNHQFSQISSDRLVCIECLNLRYCSNFDVDKHVKLAEIYAEDFDISDMVVLPSQH